MPFRTPRTGGGVTNLASGRSAASSCSPNVLQKTRSTGPPSGRPSGARERPSSAAASTSRSRGLGGSQSTPALVSARLKSRPQSASAGKAVGDTAPLASVDLRTKRESATPTAWGSSRPGSAPASSVPSHLKPSTAYGGPNSHEYEERVHAHEALSPAGVTATDVQEGASLALQRSRVIERAHPVDVTNEASSRRGPSSEKRDEIHLGSDSYAELW